MIHWSKKEKKFPIEKYKDFNMGCIVMALAVDILNNVPTDYENIKSRNDKEEWDQTVQEEMDSLIKNNTWTLTELPIEKHTINTWTLTKLSIEKHTVNSKWIFKI